MKMDAMRWDNPNNACQSLRLLAEMVRAGDATCFKITGSGNSATVRLETPSRERRRD